MEKSILIPQPGFRFVFHGTDYEITFAGNGHIRFAAIAGGKPFHLALESFEERYKNGEIQCTFAPEKLVVDPETNANIRRKERYVQTALLKLNDPTAIERLQKIIQEVASEISDELPPSPRTVARWIYKYRTSHNNALSLKNQYKGNKFLRFPPEIYQIITQGIAEIYLKPEYRSSKDVQAFVLGKLLEQGIATQYLPSQRTIQRYIGKLDPFIEMKVKKGNRVARKFFQASGISSPSPFALYMVEIDTHYLDIIIIDPDTGEPLGRPFLACAIDVFSRAIVGTYLSMFPPSAMTTLAVMKDMITRPHRGLPGGIPSIVIPDNGTEFKNNALERVCEQLKITITPSQIGTPNNKPHIERFFSTLTHSILQKLPGTTFSNPTKRGDYNSSDRATLTLDQVKTYVDEWITEVYHRAIHGSTGRAPLLIWEDATQYVKPSSSTEIDADIVCRRPVERNINHGQVVVDGLAYFSHAIATLQANGIKKVTVLIDDLNLSRVYVVDPDNKNTVIQADSTNPEYTCNLTHNVHMAVQKRKKLQTESDRQRLGKYTDLYHLWTLMQDIQSELVRKKPKLRQFKLQLPKKLNEFKQSIDGKSLFDPKLVPDPPQGAPSPLIFESFEVNKHEKL